MHTPEPSSRLKNFPLPWFSMIMGLSGFSIAWSRAEHVLSLPFAVSPFLLSATVALFIGVTLVYLLKIIRYPAAVRAEIDHPVKIAFLPTFSISMILLSTALLNGAPSISFWLWTSGTILHLLFTLYILSSWVHHDRYEIKHLNPAWFIPVVGNILVPIAGVHHAPAEVSWFFFSIGLFFWPILTGILFYRLIFHQSLPERFLPTLFIFIAPPSVGLLSWYNLTGTTGQFGLILYFVAVFFFLLMLVQASYFISIRFFLSWWAYSFPVAALTIATLILAKDTGKAMYVWGGGGMLVFLTMLIALIIIRTVRAIASRSICVEEEH